MSLLKKNLNILCKCFYKKREKREWGVCCTIQLQYIPDQYVQIPCCLLVITAKEEEQGLIISSVSNQKIQP